MKINHWKWLFFLSVLIIIWQFGNSLSQGITNTYMSQGSQSAHNDVKILSTIINHRLSYSIDKQEITKILKNIPQINYLEINDKNSIVLGSTTLVFDKQNKLQKIESNFKHW